MVPHSPTRRSFLHTLALLVLAGASFAARAGEGGSFTVVGKVTAKSGTSIRLLVDEKKNRSQDFTITEQTIVRRAREPVTIEDVEIGETAGIVVNAADKVAAVVIELRARR